MKQAPARLARQRPASSPSSPATCEAGREGDPGAKALTPGSPSRRCAPPGMTERVELFSNRVDDGGGACGSCLAASGAKPHALRQVTAYFPDKITSAVSSPFTVTS